MPIRYDIDTKGGIVRVCYEGRVTLEDVEKYFAQSYADPRRKPQMDALHDLRAITESAVASVDVQSAADFHRQRDAVFQGIRIAVVADRDVPFGLARMYELMRDEASYEVRVFRQMAEACAWLGCEIPQEG